MISFEQEFISIYLPEYLVSKTISNWFGKLDKSLTLQGIVLIMVFFVTAEYIKLRLNKSKEEIYWRDVGESNGIKNHWAQVSGVSSQT